MRQGPSGVCLSRAVLGAEPWQYAGGYHETRVEGCPASRAGPALLQAAAARRLLVECEGMSAI
jgi:hypothetical protein